MTVNCLESKLQIFLRVAGLFLTCYFSVLKLHNTHAQFKTFNERGRELTGYSCTTLRPGAVATHCCYVTLHQSPCAFYVKNDIFQLQGTEVNWALQRSI